MGNTSTATKRKYNNKVYKQVKVELKRELVESWEKRLLQDKVNKAEFIRNAIETYLATQPEV